MSTCTPTSEPSSEGGFTLSEMLIVMTILGLIATAIGAVFVTSMRATQRVATIVPGVQATQSLASWLKSDIESATMTGPTWIADSSVPGAGTGCSSLSPTEPVGAVNVLHVETKDPTGRLSAPNDVFAASYRYRPDGTLWRVWCKKLGPSIVHSELVGGLKGKPNAIYDAITNKISLKAITRNKAVDYPFSLVGSVRTVSATTLPVLAPTTTKTPHDPCQYTLASVTGRDQLGTVVASITKNSPGSSPGFLGVGTAPYAPYSLEFRLTTTGNCSDPLLLDPITGLPDPEGLAVKITVDTNPVLVVETISLTMDPAVPGNWRNLAPYYVSPSGRWQKGTYSTGGTPTISILDGYDAADPVNSPGYPITGPVLDLKVEKS